MENVREQELLRQLEEAKRIIEEQKKQLAKKDEENNNLKTKLAKAYHLLEEKINDIERKNEIIKKNNYEKFFSKSESTVKILKKSRRVTSIEKGKPGRKKGSKNYGDVLNLKPDEVIELDPIEYINASNKGEYKYIGEDSCYKIKRIPAKYTLTKIVRRKYQHQVTKQIFQPLSNFVFGNSIITPSFVSNAIYMKYCLYMPINRLSKHIKNEMGIAISNQNWWHYFDKASALLEPIYKRIREDLIHNEAKILHADETTLSIAKLDEETRKKSYVLVTTSSYYSKPICLYEFIDKRLVTGVVNTIEDFEGTIIVDAFTGYDKLKDKKINIQRCWVHARRYVTDSIKVSTKQEIPQLQLLNKINKLFDIERKIEDKSLKEKSEIRNDESIKVLKEIKEFCLKHEKTRIDTFKKAINYILNNFEELSTFTNNPMVPIHNNKAERTVSNLVLARKNFQTISTVESAKKNMQLFSIVQTAKYNGLNVEKYLNYIFNNLSQSIEDLLPYSNKLPDDLKLELK